MVLTGTPAHPRVVHPKVTTNIGETKCTETLSEDPIPEQQTRTVLL